MSLHHTHINMPYYDAIFGHTLYMLTTLVSIISLKKAKIKLNKTFIYKNTVHKQNFNKINFVFHLNKNN